MTTSDATTQNTSTTLNARASARAEARMLIGGRLVDAVDGQRFDNVSPATGQILGTTAAGTVGHGCCDLGCAQRI